MDKIEEKYQKAISDLYAQAPSYQVIGGEAYHPGLKTMEMFDTFLNHPHTHFTSIHIAGTNGKGSLSHFLASVFASLGYKVGLYTSPHLVDFRERIKIINKKGECWYSLIDKEDVLDFLDRSGEFITSNNPSFFEITTAMAFDYFKHQQVDYAIIEVGLGGRLDSTNIITPLLSIITSIGFDHKDLLGDTLGEIAYEKGGIIKKGVPVVVGEVDDEVKNVLQKIATERDAPITITSNNIFAEDRHNKKQSVASLAEVCESRLDLKGDYQKINLVTLSAALDQLCKSKILSESDISINNHSLIDSITHCAKYTGLFGRWQILSTNPMIICDIAHNEHGLKPVMNQLKQLFSTGQFGRLILIYGMAKDKDIDSILPLLPISQHETIFYYTNAIGTRAMSSKDLKDKVLDYRKRIGLSDNIHNEYVSSSVYDAIFHYRQNSLKTDLVYIGGSSYVVAEALPHF